MRTYGKNSKGKDTTEDNLSLKGQLRLQKDRHGKKDNHDVRRNVDDSVGDHMVGLSRTVHCDPLVHIPYLINGLLTVIRGNLPVVVERPAPSSKPQDLHGNESNDNIACYQLDQKVLLQTHSESC